MQGSRCRVFWAVDLAGSDCQASCSRHAPIWSVSSVSWLQDRRITDPAWAATGSLRSA